VLGPPAATDGAAAGAPAAVVAKVAGATVPPAGTCVLPDPPESPVTRIAPAMVAAAAAPLPMSAARRPGWVAVAGTSSTIVAVPLGWASMVSGVRASSRANAWCRCRWWASGLLSDQVGRRVVALGVDSQRRQGCIAADGAAGAAEQGRDLGFG
jgi:hypothetical protein